MTQKLKTLMSKNMFSFISDVMKVQAPKSMISPTTSTSANLITSKRAHGVRISSKISNHLTMKANGVEEINQRIPLTSP